MDFDLRLVRYFTVVAEHGHFGRAAEELHVAQPSLSRQIQRLEHDLGTRLLDRTPQGTRLTPAGEVFLKQAKELLAAAAQAATMTRAAAQTNRIVLGYTANIIITRAARELRNQRPEADVQTMHVPWPDVRKALLDHRVDAVVARMPFPSEGLSVTVLYDEPRGVMLPTEHRLADRESLTLADIADEPVTRGDDPEWNAFWRIDPRPDGRKAPDGPLVDVLEDKIEYVAAGEAIAIVPMIVVSGPVRPDLVLIPLDDVEPSHVALATRADDHSRLVADWREIARAELKPS
ncbi:LysR family transcriptional regulator [Kutzneria sp. CA-103260]|uniref:LysR family transcriptional regulator n=1 Tax=Kutzneria sp. CA-103260 TaxID=2802641 RepID=UPI001BEE26CA|nr:LysR family transcriptional regulator [Kutzneria sp. CA-103260]QUQ65204.1 LysR family transcriptional regulator [Kutzneria sp. CA-103260]